MRLKSYFADTVESAMSLAAQELGDEAMLVYSRESGPETRGLGRYEVVFAAEAGPASRSGNGSPGARLSTEDGEPTAPVVAGPALADLGAGDNRLWAELDRRLELLEQRLVKGSTGPPACEAASKSGETGGTGTDAGTRIVKAPGRLIQVGSGGSDPEINGLDSPTHQRAARFGETGKRQGEPIAQERPLRCDTGACEPGRTTILAGLAGVGKTTVAVKLAFWFAAHFGKRPRLVSLDTKKILGAEQLGRYARLLGSEFSAPQSAREIRALFRDRQVNPDDDQYTIVDMPGCGLSDDETLDQIREMVGHVAGGEVQLVLSAAARTADLFNAVERFASIGPVRLIFSRMDETRSASDIWTVAAQTGIPVSFLSNGTRIPDDFRAVRSDELADKLTELSRLVAITEPLVAGV